MADEIEKPVANEEHMKMIQYAHSLIENFQQVSNSIVQGVFSYHGVFYVATFHQTTIEDISNDTWSLIVDPVEFIGVVDASEETAQGEYILNVSKLEDDSSSFPE